MARATPEFSGRNSGGHARSWYDRYEGLREISLLVGVSRVAGANIHHGVGAIAG
jgi:hypothetical protein